MSDYLIKGETLTEIANAIRGKTGSTSPIKAQDFATEIEGIQAGGGEDIKYLVKVIDYDGTVLKSDNLSEGATFTLPENPTNDGLIFQEWSSPVDIVDGAITVPNSDVTIGAVYETASGMTEMDISISPIYSTSSWKMTFSNLTNLTSIDWGDGTVDRSLTHTYAKAGDYTIKIAGEKSFGNSFTNTFLKSVRYANGVITAYMPSSALSMTTITFPNSVTYISGTSNSNYSLSCLIVPPRCTNSPFCSRNYFLKSVVIPKSVTDMGGLSTCSSLTSVTIPDGVTSIGTQDFYKCSSLTSITIPDGVTSIGSEAFYQCYGLTTVTIPNSVTSIGSKAFQYCNFSDITIPDSVTTIGGYAFQSCSRLSSIIIPDGVTSIGNYAFYQCYGLTTVTIPNSVTSIGQRAFFGCVSLNIITLPENLTSIGNYAFYQCYGLTKMKIPASVTSIGSQAFYDCYNILEYDFTEHTSVPTLASSDAFSSMSADCIIKVPFALYDEWITATNWINRKNHIRPWIETVEELSNIDGTVYNYVCVGNVEYYYNGTNWEVSRQL